MLHLIPGFLSVLLRTGFVVKILYAFISSSMAAACPANPLTLDLITEQSLIGRIYYETPYYVIPCYFLHSEQ